MVRVEGGIVLGQCRRVPTTCRAHTWPCVMAREERSSEGLIGVWGWVTGGKRSVAVLIPSDRRKTISPHAFIKLPVIPDLALVAFGEIGTQDKPLPV